MCSVTQPCPTLRDPTECSLPGSSVRGISQARMLEWVYPYSAIKRKIRQKISKGIETLNTITIVNQQNLFGIYPMTAEYMVFSSSLRTYTEINHILGHKTSLNKFKRTEIM